MTTQQTHSTRADTGFSLIEVMVSLFITMIVMGAVFGLLYTGQDSFERESEVSEMTSSTRSAIRRMSQDLTMAGLNTPPTFAILWDDGTGLTPDEVTIVYADPTVSTSLPVQCGGGGGGPCNTIDQSSVLNIDPDSYNPPVMDPTTAYTDGMMLYAIETSDCNGDGITGFTPFVLTQPPKLTNAGGSPVVNLNHNPGSGSGGINPPGGFNGQVHPDCAIIGRFRVIQYRVNPLPPADNPMLERRDLGSGEDWVQAANNIENLQVQYAIGGSENLVDEPPTDPIADDPTTWITRVQIRVTGRNDKTNLKGATAGVFAADDTYLRRTFNTSVTLRNQVNAMDNYILDES